MKISLFLLFVLLSSFSLNAEEIFFIEELPSSLEQIETEQVQYVEQPQYTQVQYSSNYIWSIDSLNEFIKLTEDPILNYLSKDYNQYKIRESIDISDIVSEEEKVIHLHTANQLATEGFMAFSKDLSVGLIDWDKFQNELSHSEFDLVWEKSKKEYHYDSDLRLALKTGMLSVLMHKYMPTDKGYRDLILAYHKYSTMEFPSIDYGSLMKVGDYGVRASQLKKFLKVTGDLINSDDSYLDFPTYDDLLSDSLKKFQKRHYLKVTGELDRVTVMYTKKSASQKLDLIKLNIERYKLYPRIYEGEYMIVNIPEFSLKYYQYGEKIDDIFVVIGREDRPTPIFSDLLEYIVLNPSWIVPQGLIHKDYIPMLVSDPISFKDHGIHIHTKPSRFSKEIDPTTVNWEPYLNENTNVPYYFMQYPGDENALGRMKFIFPNKYKVYLHDTNAKSLTTLKYRLYSSGCIRLQKPYDLLSILSQKTNMDMDTMISRLESMKTTNVPLKEHIPIHIRYNTVFIDNSNSVTFRRDFYGYDKIQLNSLNK